MTNRVEPALVLPVDHKAVAPIRAAWAWLLAAAVMVLFRTFPYAWWGTLAFDSDQAVLGLMAKHISEFRALPVYQYAVSYVLILTAYVVAPFMWLLGPTPLALKLPLVLMNIAVGVSLIAVTIRAGVRPHIALILGLPVLMTAGVTNSGLMDALGMTVEPALFVIALWALRRSSLAFGVVAVVGFQVREFVAYAVAALLFLDVCTGVFLSRAGWREWGMRGLAAVGTTGLIGAAARFSSVRGPGTWTAASGDNLATLGGAFCFAPAQALQNVRTLGQWYLGALWGTTPVTFADAAVQSRVTQGVEGAWPVLAAVLLLAALRVAWHWRAVWTHRHASSVQLGAFLLLVGIQSVIVYAVSRCGPLSLLTLRYALLGVFLPTGLALLAWAVESRAAVRHLIGATFVGVAVLNAWSHARLWHEQMTQPSITNRAQLGAELESRGIHFARSDYWTAYYVSFITHERVIVGSDTFMRIDEYERLLARHEREVVRVTTDRCDDKPAIVPGYYLCPMVAP